MSALKKLVSALLVLTLAVSGGLLAWHGLHRTSAAPPAGQTQTPAVPAPPEAVPDTVSTLCVAGDLVMHIPIINSCRTDDGYDFTGLFDEARPYYESADYAAACIETTFNGPPYSGFPQFCAPDQLAGDLKSVGLDLLSTASNHSLDTWFSGLTRTLDVLDAAGLDHVGTYRTQEERDTVKVIDVGGIRLAVLAYTYGTNGLPKDEHPYCVNVFTTDYMTNCGVIDYELLKSDLARARQTDADAIAVFMHWGQEYATSPSAQQEELADFLFENGAALVLGGHVHVPQPIQSTEHVAIAAGSEQKAAIGVGNVFVHLGIVPAKPVKGSAVGPEGLVGGAKGQLIHQRGGLLRLPKGAQDVRQRNARLDGNRTEPARARQHRAAQSFAMLGEVAAGEKGTHAVSQNEIGYAGIGAFCLRAQQMNVRQ